MGTISLLRVTSRQVFYFFGQVFFFIFFSNFFHLSVSYILHFSKGVMSKLILVWCLFGTAVLAKPSRLQAKTAVRQMAERNCIGNYKRGIEMEGFTLGEDKEFACDEEGVGYFCETDAERTFASDGFGYCRRTCRNDDTPWGYEWRQLYPKVKCKTHENCVQPDKGTYSLTSDICE